MVDVAPPDAPPNADEAALAVNLTVANRWAGAVTEGSGFVAVPMALLRLQAKLELSPTDFTVLVNLLAHWWDPAKAVYPRSTTIAARMGVDKRTVQRSIQKLKQAGLVDREKVAVNGKELRAYQFRRLAARLARDIPVSRKVAAAEAVDAPAGRPRISER